MAARFKPAVRLDAGGNPVQITFDTVDQAEAWIDSELQVWGECFTDNPKKYGPPYGETLQQQRRFLQEVKQKVTQAAHAESETIDPDTVGLLTALQPFSRNNVLHSSSAVGRKAVQMMRDAQTDYEKQRAIGFLAAANNFGAIQFQAIAANRAPSCEITAFMAGIATYYAFIQPDEESGSLVHDAIKSTIRDWEQQLANHQNDHFDAVVAIDKCRKDIIKEHGRQETEFSSLKEAFETRIGELETFYHEKLRTEAPAKYWSKKATRHAWAGRIAVGAFFLFTGAIGFYGYGLARDVINAVVDNVMAESGISPLSAFQLGITRSWSKFTTARKRRSLI